MRCAASVSAVDQAEFTAPFRPKCCDSRFCLLSHMQNTFKRLNRFQADCTAPVLIGTFPDVYFSTAPSAPTRIVI